MHGETVKSAYRMLNQMSSVRTNWQTINTRHS